MISSIDSESFRLKSVRLALSGEKSISQIARDLGIKESTLYNWMSIARRKKSECINGSEKISSAQLIDELSRLRKVNTRLKEEREILKKAAVFFAKEEQKRWDMNLFDLKRKTTV